MDESTVVDLVEDEPDEPSCRDAVLLVFPDICPDHLTQLASQHGYQSDAIISHILDQQENGESYPTRPQDNPLKRKREDDDDDSDEGSDDNAKKSKEPETITAIRSEIANPDYVPRFVNSSYRDMAKTLLCQDFPRAPVKSIKSILAVKRHLFDAYDFMDEATHNWNEQHPPWRPKVHSSKPSEYFQPGRIENLDLDSYSEEQKKALAEFRAARELSAYKESRATVEDEEKANFAEAQRNGQTAECGCCYDEQALNRMAQCNGDTPHFFCGNCVRQQAETQVGYSKYELQCMSMEGCHAGFSFAVKKRFLDKGLRTALDRIEQEAMLREAGIENLETCPFCPFAAEYPPVEQDKEFRCERPGCRKVSCRLCRKETHIPKTCAEVSATEEGLTARRQIEEAMSLAIIRKCNKCQNPFVKEVGCNKITCTRCGTITCYVCRQTVKDYTHFNDRTRGGKSGQCPLFDESVDERHQVEVELAEKVARAKVTQERPDVDNEALQIKISKKVEDEDKQRRSKMRIRLGPRDQQIARAQMRLAQWRRRGGQFAQPPQIPAPAAVPAGAPVPVPAGQPAPAVVPNAAQVPPLNHGLQVMYPPLPQPQLPLYFQGPFQPPRPMAAGPENQRPFADQQDLGRWMNSAPAQPAPEQPIYANQPDQYPVDWPFLHENDVDGINQVNAPGYDDDYMQRLMQGQFDYNLPGYGALDNGPLQPLPQAPPPYIDVAARRQADVANRLRDIRNSIWRRVPLIGGQPLNPALDPKQDNEVQAGANALAGM